MSYSNTLMPKGFIEKSMVNPILFALTAPGRTGVRWVSGLFLLMLAMLTTVVSVAESSVVRDTLLVLVVLIRLMMLLGSIDFDNWDRASRRSGGRFREPPLRAWSRFLKPFLMTI